MKQLQGIVFLTLIVLISHAQPVTERALVVQTPQMAKVVVKENNAYRTVNDTTLHFDTYYPPGFAFKQNLPLVIFANGVGIMELYRWKPYKDWARLMAANGMIAMNYQAREGRSLDDGAALIDFLVANASKLNVDPNKIAIWTGSANNRVAMRLAYKVKPQHIKTAVMYYGGTDSLGELRQDLPLLIVRAGLDAQFLNTGIDNFLQSALQQDARVELINYINGIHAFDIYTKTDEAKSIILKTVDFLKTNLNSPALPKEYVLTNKNFMWLVMNNQLPRAVEEFRKARTRYRADSTFHPYYNAVIREDVLNANAYWLLRNNRKTDALELFKLNVESYPGSANAYDGLADGYEANGDKDLALKNAELCLQKLTTATNINPQFKERVKASAEEKIKRLKGS